MIIQGSNVPISIKFDSSLLNVQDIKVAVYQKPGQILKDFNFEDISIEGDRIVIPVTQEVTAGLPDGLIFLEIKWLSGDGYIHFAKPVRDEVLRRNDKRVLSGKVTGTEEELEMVEIEQFTIVGEGGAAGIDRSEISKMISDFFNAHKDELNGKDGHTPQKGIDYFDGKDGIGISNITTSKSNGVTTVTIKLTDDTVKSFTVKDGADGIDGKSAYQLAVEKGYIGTLEEWLDSLKGISPIKGRDYFTSAEKQELINEVVSKMHVPTDGYTPVKGVDYFTAQEIAEFINTVKNGVSDGKTPIKGTDYFTNADKQELIQSVIAELPQAESEEF